MVSFVHDVKTTAVPFLLGTSPKETTATRYKLTHHSTGRSLRSMSTIYFFAPSVCPDCEASAANFSCMQFCFACRPELSSCNPFCPLNCPQTPQPPDPLPYTHCPHLPSQVTASHSPGLGTDLTLSFGYSK